jgi:hypothetical protein
MTDLTEKIKVAEVETELREREMNELQAVYDDLEKQRAPLKHEEQNYVASTNITNKTCSRRQWYCRLPSGDTSGLPRRSSRRRRRSRGNRNSKPSDDKLFEMGSDSAKAVTFESDQRQRRVCS